MRLPEPLPAPKGVRRTEIHAGTSALDRSLALDPGPEGGLTYDAAIERNPGHHCKGGQIAIEVSVDFVCRCRAEFRARITACPGEIHRALTDSVSELRVRAVIVQPVQERHHVQLHAVLERGVIADLSLVPQTDAQRTHRGRRHWKVSYLSSARAGATRRRS